MVTRIDAVLLEPQLPLLLPSTPWADAALPFFAGWPQDAATHLPIADCITMRILHVITDMRMGGAERVLCQLALHAREAGHRVEVVALKGVGPAAQPLVNAGIPCTALGAPDQPGLGHLAAVARLQVYLRTRRFDVVHAWLASGCAAVQMAAPPPLPRVMAAHVTDVPSWTVCRLLAADVGAPVQWLAVSAAVARAWAAALHVDVKRFAVIPNGMDAGPPPQPEPPNARPAFLGRLAHQKGVDVLVRALQETNLSVDVFGRGEDESALRELATTSGVASRIHFHGPTHQPHLAISQASFVVLPSRSEGMPMVVLEAMAAGRAVVATRVGGTDEVVVDGETGLLVPPNDPTALAHAMQRLQQDGALRQQLGTRGRQRLVTHFNLATSLSATLDLYAALTSQAA